MNTDTIIFSAVISALMSLIVSLVVTRYRFYQKSKKEEKEEIRTWKKDMRNNLRKIQSKTTDLTSENLKKDEEIENLDSLEELEESITLFSDRLKEAPVDVDTDLEMRLAKIEFLWDSMSFWEVYNEEEIKDEFWFEIDEVKKQLEKDL